MQSFLLISALISVAQGFSPAFLSRQSSRQSSALSMARGPPRGRRPQMVVVQKPPMNEGITAEELRVTTPSATGKDVILGIMSRADALAKAKEMGGLDLILVNAQSDPPVCKIADYSKYRYNLEKKAKELKKNSKATEIKEVKMSYKIDVHDYEVRKKSAIKFLKQGNRVKCTVMFRGREVTHDNLGFNLLEKLSSDLEEMCQKESRAKREGRNLSLILSPRVELLKQVNEDRKARDKAKKKLKETTKEEKLAAKNAGLAVDDEDEDDDDDEDDDYDDDDEDDDDLGSLDEMLSGDKFTEDLFS
jgi:translation initiation factor IF-3